MAAVSSDAIGWGDPYSRRPGYILYLNPGVGLAVGKQIVTLSLPIRMHQDFQESLFGNQGGDLAKYLVIADDTLRF